jgi:glycopeptide antibiotics resistance protein
MGNVLLFIPLGAAIAFVPRSRRKVLLVAGGLTVPFVIEGLQLLVPALGRGCESADVFDNLLGLVIGLVLGAVTAWLLRDRRTRRDTSTASESL